MFKPHLKILKVELWCVVTLDYIPKNDLNYLQSKVNELMLPFLINLISKL